MPPGMETMMANKDKKDDGASKEDVKEAVNQALEADRAKTQMAQLGDAVNGLMQENQALKTQLGGGADAGLRAMPNSTPTGTAVSLASNSQGASSVGKTANMGHVGGHAAGSVKV